MKSGGDIVSGAKKFTKKFGLPEPKNWHLPKHNYTGPFTELRNRLDVNDNPLPGYEPFNKIDEIAMKHDICYREADTVKDDPLSRSKCDKQMLDRLDVVKTKGLREKIDYAIVKPVIWVKYKMGLGNLSEELHKPIRRKFKRRRVMVFNVDDIWSADLTNSFQSLAKQNKNYKYMLNVIDLFSKYAYSIPLKTKSADEVTEQFDKLFKFSKRKPSKLWTDQGSEFTNNKFKHFLKENNIELYHVYNEGKACIIERFNRTLGEMIQKYLTDKDTSKYIDILQDLLDKYNNTNHSTIKMTPYEASQPEKEEIVREIYLGKPAKREKPVFKIGDRVRLGVSKNTFEKGYTYNWTPEIFVVTDVIKHKDNISYTVKDLQGEPILGSWYKQELQKSDF